MGHAFLDTPDVGVSGNETADAAANSTRFGMEMPIG